MWLTGAHHADSLQPDEVNVIRFGILGFGLHAVKRLVPGFRLARKARLQALSRRDLQQAQASAQEFDVPLAFDSAEALCHSPEVDAIFVATPNACHHDDVLLALECGKPVLCEKPMAMNAAECRDMIVAADKAKLPLGVAQIFRFCESVHRIREHLVASSLGNPVFARAEFSYWGRGHARAWINDARLAGGGPIMDVGVHCIDTLRFILRDEVAAVHASGITDVESGELEAAAVLTLEMASGPLAIVLVSTRAQYRTPLEIVGEHGVLLASDALSVEHPVHVELLRGDQRQVEEVSNHRAYGLQVDAFADAVAGVAPFPVSGEEGWRNQLALDAAYRSLRSGRTVMVES